LASTSSPHPKISTSRLAIAGYNFRVIPNAEFDWQSHSLHASNYPNTMLRAAAPRFYIKSVSLWPSAVQIAAPNSKSAPPKSTTSYDGFCWTCEGFCCFSLYLAPPFPLHAAACSCSLRVRFAVVPTHSALTQLYLKFCYKCWRPINTSLICPGSGTSRRMSDAFY